MKKQNIIIALVIIIIALLAIVGVFAYKFFVQPIQAQPTQIDISSWKTYKNNELNFSFRYPVEIELKNGVTYNRADCLDMNQIAKYMPAQSLASAKGFDVSVVCQKLEEEGKEEVANGIKLSSADSIQKILVAGKESYLHSFSGINDNYYKIVQIPLDDNTYISIKTSYYLNTLYRDNSYKLDDKSFDKMLSTFKFTK